MRVSNLVELWNRFLFSLVSPFPVAAYRILQGLMIIQVALSFIPDLYLWFGSPGIISLQTTKEGQLAKLNIFAFFPESNEWVLVLWVIYLLAAVCFTVGYQTRLASIVVFIMMVNFANRNLYLLHAGDTFMRSMSYWFVFAPAGEVWSVDSYLKRRRSKDRAPYCPLISAWTWRAMQLQMCLVYYSAFTSKTPGWYWANGESCYIAARFESLARLPLPLSPDNIHVSHLLTYGTLFIEFALFTLIWIKEIRYYVIALAICLHLFIDWSMSIPAFEWLMIASFVLFVDPEHIDRTVGTAAYWIKRPFRLKTETKVASP